MKKQREQLLDNNDKRWAQAIDDLASCKNILKEKTQLIADLYQEKYELKEANLELKKVVRKQARQIDELNAKLYTVSICREAIKNIRFLYLVQIRISCMFSSL